MNRNGKHTNRQKIVQLRMSDDLHRAVKLNAVRSGWKINDLGIFLFAEWVNQIEVERRKKTDAR